MYLFTSASKHLLLTHLLLLSYFMILACGKVEYEAPQPVESDHNNQKITDSSTTTHDQDDNDNNNSNNNKPAQPLATTLNPLGLIHSYLTPKPKMPDNSAEMMAPYTCDFTANFTHEIFTKHYNAGVGFTDPDGFTDTAIKHLLNTWDGYKIIFTHNDLSYLTDKYSADIFTDFIYHKSCSKALQLKADVEAIITQRLRDIERIIFTQHDFHLVEYVAIEGIGPQLLRPKTYELADRQRKIVKYLFILFKKAFAKNGVDINSKRAQFHILEYFKSKYNHLKSLSDQRFLFDFSSAHLNAMDINTELMNSEEASNYHSGAGAKKFGLGIGLMLHKNYIRIKNIAKGGAAMLDGRLKVGDYIISVKDDNNNWINVANVSMDQFISHITGAENTPVSLKVLTPIGDDTRKKKRYTLTLRRKGFNSSNFDYSIGANYLYTVNDPTLHKPISVGYIAHSKFISQPDYKSSIEISKSLKKLIDQGADAIIIDYRNNPGGMITDALNNINIFAALERPETGIFQQTLVSRNAIQHKIPAHYQVESMRGKMVSNVAGAYSIPLVFIINGKSASASELVTGSLKSHGRALIVGHERTFGKGTIQNLQSVIHPFIPEHLRPYYNNPVKPIGLVKYTFGKYFLPNGESLQIRGLASDIVIPTYNHWNSPLPLDHPLQSHRLSGTHQLPRDPKFLMNLGFRDSSLLQKLQQLYTNRTSSAEYLTKHQAWLAEVDTLNRYETGIYLNAKDDSISAQLTSAQNKAYADFIKYENVDNAEIANQLRSADHMLNEALYIAAHYYQLCRHYDDGSIPKYDYNKSAGCLGSSPVNRELKSKAEAQQLQQELEEFKRLEAATSQTLKPQAITPIEPSPTDKNEVEINQTIPRSL